MKTAVAGICLATGNSVMAEDVLLENEGLSGPLAATIAGPLDSGEPGIVIIPGSGPTDRDANSPLGVNAAPYRLLANALQAEGIASLRMDKRGMFGSASAASNANEVTFEDYARDVLGWSSVLREKTGAQCVWLLGHSEGGVVALRTALTDSDDLCGLILVASPGRRIGELLIEQLGANPGAAPLMDEIENHIATLESGKRIEDEVHPGLVSLFGPQIQTFMLSFMAQDPQSMIAEVELPVLIVQGREDLQVTEVDAQALAQAQPEATMVLLDGVNHVLKAVPASDVAANRASYANPDLPLADGVVETIVKFVSASAD